MRSVSLSHIILPFLILPTAIFARVYMSGIIGEPPTAPPPSDPQTCVHDYNYDATNILQCPLQHGAEDILCAQEKSSKNAGPSNLRALCNPRGSAGKDGGVCQCKDGRWCCDPKVTVPGGEAAVDYFMDVGCDCARPFHILEQ